MTDKTTPAINPVLQAITRLRHAGHLVQIDEFLPGVFAFRIGLGPELTPVQFLQVAGRML